jgi:hypothetical protein
MVICACGLLPNPAKVPNLNIGHDDTLWIRNFMVMMKNPRISILRLGPMAHGYNPAKVPKFKYKAIDREFHADDE